jgi:hypothetical protein
MPPARGWITFEQGETSFDATDRRTTKKTESNRQKTDSRRTDPLIAGKTITPLQPPRFASNSPRNKMQRTIPPSPNQPSTISHSGRKGFFQSTPAFNPFATAFVGPKSDSLTGRNNSASGQTWTSSSSSESEQVRRERIKSRSVSIPRGRGRNRESVEPTPQLSRPKSITRDSNVSSSIRGRSFSLGAPKQRKRSSSYSSRASNTNNKHADRGRDRSRPPATSNNSTTVSRGRSNSRTRSASLSRVTGIPPPASQRKGSLRPPLTLPGRHKHCIIAGPRSIGPGGVSLQDNVNDSTEHLSTSDDENIGRDIAFADSPTKSKLKYPKKVGGLMEKLFGNHLSKAISVTLPGSFKYEIRPRILLAATVYHNTATNLWITTINTNQRGVARDPATANRYLKAFSFSTEREAREAAIANAPPKMVPFNESPCCFLCMAGFAVLRRSFHCRNCGVCICKECSTSWQAKCIPETYNLKKEATVKICLSCHSLSSSFKRSLLEGDYDEALALYDTGNVNLRTPFPVFSKKDEMMHPIHSAAEGGNLDVVRWLIDDHFCPIKHIRTESGKKYREGNKFPIVTSQGRSILSISVERVKVDIMRYLVIECGVSVYECTDLNHTLRALEAALMGLPATLNNATHEPKCDLPFSTRWDNDSFDYSEPSGLEDD